MHLPSLARAYGLAALFTTPIQAGKYLNYSSPYSFDANYAHNPAWMSQFPSSTNITSLSIPGTHDTMTSSAVLGEVYQCQNHHLGTQLEAGIRYLDIRGIVVNDELLIYHGPMYTGFTWTYVLETLFNFLEKYPSEAVLMRLKEEGSAINSTLTFEEAFNYSRLNSSKTAPGCSKHLYIPTTPGPTAIPTLGDLRSKILIIQNFGDNPAKYGVKYESPLLVIEDLWELGGLADLDVKFDAIVDGLEAAGNGTEAEDGLLYLNHLSASEGVNPIVVAAGTKDGSVAGENDRTGIWLRDGRVQGESGATGVVIIDFPGKKLVEEVLARNFVTSA